MIANDRKDSKFIRFSANHTEEKWVRLELENAVLMPQHQCITYHPNEDADFDQFSFCIWTTKSYFITGLFAIKLWSYLVYNKNRVKF